MSKLYDLLSAMCGKIKKPDWNQNDPTAPNYVKNRPFWTDDPVETVLIEEITNEWATAGADEMLSLVPIDFVEGRTYTVMFDGIEYECVPYIATGPNSLSIGDGSIAGAGNDGSDGEPFFITVYNGATLVFVNETGEHTVSVSGIRQEVHKIDKRYIPDSDVKGSLAADGLELIVRSSAVPFLVEIPAYGNEPFVYENISLQRWNNYCEILGDNRYVDYNHLLLKVNSINTESGNKRINMSMNDSIWSVNGVTLKNETYIAFYDEDAETVSCWCSSMTGVHISTETGEITPVS